MSVLKKKQLIISVIAATLCMSLLLASSWALFSDKETGSVQGKAGTVDISLDCLSLGNPDNINPGDNDPNNPPDAAPGTPHPLNFNVFNKGNKSVRCRVTIILTVEKNGAIIDPLVFSIYNRDATGKSTTEAIVKYIITASQPNGVAAASYSQATHGAATGIKYILPESILNGTGTAAEIENGISTTQYDGKFNLVLSRTADNFYQGVDVNIQVIAEAMQYRNTNAADWETISNQSITTKTGTVKGVPSKDQKADGTTF